MSDLEIRFLYNNDSVTNKYDNDLIVNYSIYNDNNYHLLNSHDHNNYELLENYNDNSIINEIHVINDNNSNKSNNINNNSNSMDHNINNPVNNDKNNNNNNDKDDKKDSNNTTESTISSNDTNDSNDSDEESFLWFTEPIDKYNDSNLVIALIGDDDDEKQKFVTFIRESYKLPDTNYATNTTNAYRLIGLNIESKKYDIRIISVHANPFNISDIKNDGILTGLCTKGTIDYIICILKIDKIDNMIYGCLGVFNYDKLSILRKSLKYIQDLCSNPNNLKLIVLNGDKDVIQRLNRDKKVNIRLENVYFIHTNQIFTDMIHNKYNK